MIYLVEDDESIRELVIYTLNHDASISSILDPSERIQNVVEKYKKGEAID